MITRTQLYILLFIAALVWGGALFIYGVDLSLLYLKPFSIVAAVVLVTLATFDRWAWRWPVVHSLIAKRPDLQGIWRVTIQSSHPHDGGSVIPPITAYAIVRQTFSSLSFRLLSPESSSTLVAHSITPTDGDRFSVVMVYRNTPRSLLRGGRSEIHHGTVVLEAGGLKPQSLRGEYFTDRNTRGEIVVEARKDETNIDDYVAAQALFS